MNWEITEVKALDFIKTSFDPAAYLVGGADSTKSDIFSPKYDCYIEVKDLSQGDVRLGQYTDSTKHQIQPYLDKGLDVFVDYWYSQKNVEYFCLYTSAGFLLLSKQDFIYRFKDDFYLQTPYKKRSGSRKLTKSLFCELRQKFNLSEQDGRVYCFDLKPHTYFDFNGYHLFVNRNNEIRIISNTCNMTYHICLQGSI